MCLCVLRITNGYGEHNSHLSLARRFTLPFRSLFPIRYRFELEKFYVFFIRVRERLLHLKTRIQSISIVLFCFVWRNTYVYSILIVLKSY